VHYYGVGFGQRNTPARRGAVPRGPSTVRGNAARPQSSLFESMDTQPTSPMQDSGKPTDFVSPTAPSNGRPTAWTTAVGEDSDNGMKVDDGPGTGSHGVRPVQFGSGASSGGTADILRNIIKETSPQGKGGISMSARPSGVRPMPKNPYMVTGNETTTTGVSLPAFAPQVCFLLLGFRGIGIQTNLSRSAACCFQANSTFANTAAAQTTRFRGLLFCCFTSIDAQCCSCKAARVFCSDGADQS
jgi:hypothetical protein